ncbi:hypothetical protein M1403_00940 [Patescibacteria group bacterium]|nr:hypothetical protein [Patescibacteria group bacterium]
MKFSKVTLKKNGPITDFAAERNILLEKAEADWVLFVDSDEEVTAELEEEISRLDNKYYGYYIRRKDFFLGKWLRHGETGNIKLLRLGKKDAGQWKRSVHEYWDIKNAATLKNYLLHDPHTTIADFISKINYYTDIDARELVREGKTFSYWRVVTNPAAKFFQNYLWRLGFLDGAAGFVHAFMMSFQSLVVRVKQYEDQDSHEFKAD